MKQWRKWKQGAVVLAAVVSAGLFVVPPVWAETSSSSHYQLTESQFGSSSTDENCSGSYCSKAVIGSLTIGRSSNGETTAAFGPLSTDSKPALEVIVDPGESDLGTLKTDRTATKTMVVRVRSYQSDGYTLQITGDPPKYDGHTLHTPTAPTASKPGTEQFAINATANTSPSVGANPVQVPDSGFSFGEVNDNYKMPNMFMYHSGDVVAHSETESGETDYTISMIVNVSNMTPAGHYSADFSAVVIPVY